MAEKRWRFRWLCAWACRRENRRLPETARIFYRPERVNAADGDRRWAMRSRHRVTT